MHPSPTAERRVYDLLRAQIADAALPPGARLPSTRALATDLGLSRTTVTAAYEQLAAEGFIATAPGKVARVAAAPGRAAPPGAAPRPRAEAAPVLSAFGRRAEGLRLSAVPAAAPAQVDFLYGAVAAADFPASLWRRAWQAELAASTRRDGASLYYQPPEGDAALRGALQACLRRSRGIACEPDQILVVHGAQQAIDLCARVLLDPGDTFAIEDPAYLMARRCFEATGARGIAVPVDSLGLDVDRLPQPGRTEHGGRGVRLVYVTPSHQFPLGGVLPIGRRQALLQWARRHRAWIVEDDYDGEFRYGQRPIDALQSLDPDGRVLYVGTFSKALSPHLRLGYLVLPHALVPAFRQAKRLTDRHAPVLEQRVLARLIDSGAYERHVRRIRRQHERRRDALLAAVARHLGTAAQVGGSAAGLHLVLWLPALAPGDEPALADAARRAGVGVYPVSPLFAEAAGAATAARPRPAGLILGYASLAPAAIDAGIATLAHVLHAFRPGARRGTPGL